MKPRRFIDFLSQLYSHLILWGLSETIAFIQFKFNRTKYLPKHDQAIVRYFRRNFSQILDKYKKEQYPDEIISMDAPIWTYWNRGESAIPSIGKKCLESIRKKSGSHPVFLLDDALVHQIIDGNL